MEAQEDFSAGESVTSSDLSGLHRRNFVRLSLLSLLPSLSSGPALLGECPTKKVSFDNIRFPLRDALKRIEGIHSVERLVSPETVHHRIIHLRHAHYLPKNELSIFLNVSGEFLSDQELEQRHQEYVNILRTIHEENKRILKNFIHTYGLQTIFFEIPQSKQTFTDALQRVREDTDGIRVEDRLLISAAGELYCEGALKSLVLLDDFAMKEIAGNLQAQGKEDIAVLAQEKRENSVVRKLLKEQSAFLLWGGVDNFKGNIEDLSDDCEYISITTEAYNKLGPLGRDKR